MKFQAMVLAAASVLGSAAAAMAQQPPPPTPTPPAVTPPSATQPEGQAPPADPNAPAAAPGAPAPGAAAPGAPAPGAAAPAPAAPAQPAPAAQPQPPSQPPPLQGAQETQAPPPPVFNPQVTFGTAPPGVGADKSPEEALEDAETPLRWRGTTFTWNHAATTTLLGVGRDNIGGEEEVYSWAFNLRPRFYIVDLPNDKLSASADIGWEVELTDSSLTTDRNEVLFQDMTLGLGYAKTLWESGGSQKGEHKTTASLSGSFRLPTSKVSLNQGKYLTTYLGPSVTQQIKILGKKADGLNNVTVRVGTMWGHLFSEAYTPVNGDLNRTRQNATGQTILSDQLSGTSFALNTLTTTLGINLPIYRGLQLSTEFGHIASFKHQSGDDGGCHTSVATDGCISVPPSEDATLYQPNTAFRIGLGYGILDVVDFELGYQNIARAIGEDGERRSMFYSPDAQFYVDLTANLDAIYLKAARATKKKPAPAQTASR
jgi:hypothetical protein